MAGRPGGGACARSRPQGRTVSPSARAGRSCCGGGPRRSPAPRGRRSARTLQRPWHLDTLVVVNGGSMKKAPSLVGWIGAGLMLASSAEAGGVAISGRAGSLGLGLELTAGITDRLNARVGGNAFSYSRTFDQDDGDEFDLDLELRTFTALLDLHPFGGGFRLSGGVVSNSNEAGVVGRSPDSYEI